MCYYTSISVPVPVTVLQSWHSNHPAMATMTSWCGRCEATEREVSGKVYKPRPRSRFQRQSAEPQAVHWCGQALVSVVSYCLGFSKTNSYWKGTVRTVAFSAGSFNKNQSFSVSFYEKVMMGKTFLRFWNCGVWGEREGKHKRVKALKTGLSERALTMQALCYDLVCPHWAEQRNGKDYPQECLGCPQTERAAWLANGREACRAAG